MPIVAEGSFDPNTLVVTSGYLNDLLDVNDSGRFHGCTLVWNTGYGTTPGTWIVGTGAAAEATGSLNGLADVNVDGVSSGQYLVYRGSVIGWTGVTFTGGATNLVGLTDVNVGTPVTNLSLIYGTTGWIQGYPSGSFNLMSGLVLANLSSSGRQFLVYDGTRFINRSGTLGDLSGVNSIQFAVSGQSLVYKGSVEGWQPVPIISATGLSQSYISGVYDVTLYGVNNSNLSTGIASSLQTLVNSLPDNSSLRFPPGDYWLNRTIHFTHKRNLDIIAHGARFYETSDRRWMNSGVFYFDQCTGIDWHGGSISGVADFNFLTSIASGLEYSGSAFADLAADSFETRNVIPRVFNLEKCSNMLFDHFDASNKYTYAFTYRCLDISFINSSFIGVLTGGLNRLDTLLVPIVGTTGVAQKGDIDKESSRVCYAFTIIKGRDCRISNCYTQDCGGFLVAGSNSFGGGQGPTNPEFIAVSNSSARNSHDNAIYLSSAHKSKIQNFSSINDSTLPHTIDGIKARGSHIIFDNCYIEHTHHAFGFEGIGGNPTASDYWTNYQDPGWSSEGCVISNCQARDVATVGVFLDGDEDAGTFPRDATIKDCYFYQCYLGPSGRSPTGYWISSEATSDTSAVIKATDGYRVKILRNTIENTGSQAPDQAIFVGRKDLAAGYYITGCVIEGNTILGAKIGITLKNLDYATVRNNYGERIGINNYNHVAFSGTPTLINCNNVTNSRFIDNIVVPTGHALVLRVKPGSTWSNNILRDNMGTEEIN